jgi:hypothetical protein
MGRRKLLGAGLWVGMPDGVYGMSTDVEQVNIHDLLQAGRERQTGNRPHLQACKSRNQMKALAATFVAQPHKYSSTHAVRESDGSLGTTLGEKQTSISCPRTENSW